MREKNKEINKEIKNNFINFEPYEKYTVFGMNNFIEPKMIIVNRQVEQYVVDEVFKVSQKIRVDVDKSKLEKWLDLCVKLDNIEETDLIDFATKKRFSYLKAESEQLKKENEELKSAQNKLAIEKLEKVLDFIYSNKWTNIELCVDNSPLKIIRNKLDTMLAELKGEK